MTIGVLIADDQDLVRLGFAMLVSVERDIRLVGEAADGAAAVDLARSLRPDVVLMDVRMPVLDGIEATRRIVAEAPGTRVIILTTFDLDDYALGGLDAGASGFLLKDASGPEVIRAIRAVASGDAAISPRVTRLILDRYGGRLLTGEHERADAAAPAVIDTLTEREHAVFLALAEGLSNAEIAERLWLSESTVKTHIGRILMKLGVRDRVQAVLVAYRAGLV